MSRYLDHDAAGWVERNLIASVRDKPTKRERELASEGRGWFGALRVTTPEGGGEPRLNEFHKKAFQIIGMIGGGIYNCPIPWHLVHWHKKTIIVVWQWGDGFGTWDFDKMTMMWMLCHSARIRGYIGAPAGGRKMIELFFSERSHEGGMSTRHPSIEEALDSFFSWYPQSGPLSLSYPGDRPFPLPAIKQAIHDHHHALDTRQHGTVSAYVTIEKIEQALGTPWVQGATLPKEPATTAAES